MSFSICPTCGVDIAADAKRCPHCGGKHITGTSKWELSWAAITFVACWFIYDNYGILSVPFVLGIGGVGVWSLIKGLNLLGQEKRQMEIRLSRDANNTVQTDPHVEGKTNGQCEERLDDGTIATGQMVNGERHGQWELRYPDGGVATGPYVNGKMHGQWKNQLSDGGVQTGSFVNGEMHGRWEVRYPDGRVEYETH